MNGRRLPNALAGANVTGPDRDRSTYWSGAPYGYRYVRKSDTSAAYYEVIEREAARVRRVYEMYTQQGLSINAIARLLNEQQIPIRTRTTRWERSTVWGMLRNPAYRGRACCGKTELRPRQRITRALRKRGDADLLALWAMPFIAPPRAPRRASFITTGAWVRMPIAIFGARFADNPPVRQDHLDAVVWKELVRLLEDPSVIQEELNRRVEAARKADPLKQRQESLHREQGRLEKSMDHLTRKASSLNRSRLPPSCSRSTRFSS
jgi:hypothetical protein